MEERAALQIDSKLHLTAVISILLYFVCLFSSRGSRTQITISACGKDSCYSCPRYPAQQPPGVRGRIKGMGDTDGRTAPRTAVPVLLTSCSEMLTNGLHELFQCAFENLWL